MDELRSPALEAANDFFIRKGYEVLELDWKEGDAACDVIAREGDCLVFAFVSASTSGFVSVEKEREDLEKVAATYLASHPDTPDGPIRFDAAEIHVVADERAILRHCTDFLEVD